MSGVMSCLRRPFAGLDRADRRLAASCFLVFAALLGWELFVVPMNNDETNHYHILSCLYEAYPHIAAQLQECSNADDLYLPFGLHMPRASPYVGVTASLLYAPFYFLFHSAAGQYAYDLSFFVAFAFLMARLTRRPALSFFVILSFFPFSFNFIHNMGPVNFAMLLFPGGVWCARHMAEEKRGRAFACGFLLAILLFMGVEEKSFFLYLLPGLGFFLLAFIGDDFSDMRARIWRARHPILLCAVLFGGLLALLLFSHRLLPPGQAPASYLDWLRAMRKTHNTIPLYDMADMGMGEKWLRFLFFWPHYAGRFYVTEFLDAHGAPQLSFVSFAAMCALPCLLYGVCAAMLARAYLRREVSGVSARAVLLLLSFLAAVATFRFLGVVWAGHHFVFIWVPLAVLFCDFLAGLDPSARMSIGIAFLIANIAPALWLADARPHYEVSRERDRIAAFFDDTKLSNSIVSYRYWGYHFIQKAYGPYGQIITIDPLASDEKAQELADALQTTHRQLYYVCRIADPDNTAEIFFGPHCDARTIEAGIMCGLKRKAAAIDMLPDLKIWHVFRIDFQGADEIDTGALGCRRDYGISGPNL